MKHQKAFSLVLLSLFAAAALAASPYAGQESRAIKALSQGEVAGLLAGKGMGFGKAAELNGYAGPAHVLELAAELELTAEQRVRTEALFESMLADAQAAGRLLVDKERELDRLFATRAISPERLAGVLREIGELQARVRLAHLNAHLAQVEILTPEQNAKYAVLRGYDASGQGTDHAHGH